MLTQLKSVLGDTNVLTSADVMAAYCQDWSGQLRSTPIAVVTPHQAEQVVDVLRIATEFDIAVVTQGGNTSLVGGAVGGDWPHIILSTRKLRERMDFDATTRQLTVSAGYTISEVQAFARSVGLEYRVDLASRDSATIGGTVATNAGGIRVIAHGMTRAQVLGIEMVLSDGEVLDHLNSLPKDNTGPDVTGLAVGSEGTLGVITAVRVQLHSPRVAVWTALVPMQSVDAAIAFCQPLIPQLLAAELFSARAANEVAAFKNITSLPSTSEWFLLVEGDGEMPIDALPADAMVATQSSDVEKFWMYRELQTEVISHHSSVIKIDVSVALSELNDFVENVKSTALDLGHVEDDVYFFGHVMDGNLHIAIANCVDHHELSDSVIALVVEAGGAISAEHGIGQLKNQYLPLVRTGRELELFWSVRRAFDPTGLMNPHVLCQTHNHA